MFSVHIGSSMSFCVAVFVSIGMNTKNYRRSLYSNEDHEDKLSERLIIFCKQVSIDKQLAESVDG